MALAFACATAAAAAGARAPRAVVLENQGVRLALDPSFRLAALQHPRTETRFLRVASPGAPLWEVVFRGPDRQAHAVQAGPGWRASVARGPGEGRSYRFAWRGLDVGDDAGVLDVEVRATVPAGSGATLWRISVRCRSRRFALWEVHFPRLSPLGPIGRPEEDAFLDPFVMGRLTPNPYRNLLPRYLHYPGYASFQLCALTNEQHAGLYYAALDGKGYYKHFNIGRTEDQQHVGLSMTHFPENQGVVGTSYEMPYPVAIGAFRGDWWTAAKVYRRWAVRQPWCARGPLARTREVPEWYRTLSSWEFIGGAQYDRMLEYGRRLGMEWANHWNYIWKHPGQGDVGSPDLFPPVGGEEAFRAGVRRVQAGGVRLVPYVLGSCLDIAAPQYREWNVEPWVVRDEAGSPFIWVYYGGKVRFPWPCPYPDFWPETMATLSRRIMGLGVDGIYYDTTTGNGYQCFSPDHGHPVGGGRYWTEGTLKLLGRCREEIRSVRPDGIMTAENPCEVYLGQLDGFLLFNAHFPHHVPAFQAIYHDYVCLYGNSLATGQVMGKDYPFALPVGISFISGDQLGWFSATDRTMAPEHAQDLRWLRRLAHFRRKCAQQYLGEGEMVRPPALLGSLPVVSGQWWPWGEEWGGDIRRPALLHSAWRAADGSLGLVVLNITAQAHEAAFRLRAEEYGFPCRSAVEAWSLSLDGGEQPLRSRYGSFPDGRIAVRRRLEPYEVWALELRRRR